VFVFAPLSFEVLRDELFIAGKNPLYVLLAE